jgi:hypothetical protein
MEQATTNILTYIAFAVGVLSSVLAAINHTRVRSVCCGKKIEVSLDVDKTTPKDKSEATVDAVSGS